MVYLLQTVLHLVLQLFDVVLIIQTCVKPLAQTLNWVLHYGGYLLVLYMEFECSCRLALLDDE